METPIRIQIETLMKGKNNFVIFLKNEVKPHFGDISVSKKQKQFEIMPNCDEIHFYNIKNGVNVRYVRVYSDFPSSESNFLLSNIERVEETLPAPA